MSGLDFRARSCLLTLVICFCAGHPAEANLLVNGSFETGPDPGDAIQLDAGSTAIDGWVVSRTNIDYCGTRWSAAQGLRSLGLNGSDAGGIAQTFASVPHAQYTMRCYMAGDPFSTAVIKLMRVEAAGQSADFSADITDMWPWDPGWNPHVWSFTAESTSTTIEFYSLRSGNLGPALDSVSVEITSTVDVGRGGATAFVLSSPVPNPTRNACEIGFSLPQAMRARVSVFDLAGREIAVLADGVLSAERHVAAWSGRSGSVRAPAGVCLVELRTPERRMVRRLILLP